MQQYMVSNGSGHLQLPEGDCYEVIFRLMIKIDPFDEIWTTTGFIEAPSWPMTRIVKSGIGLLRWGANFKPVPIKVGLVDGKRALIIPLEPLWDWHEVTWIAPDEVNPGQLQDTLAFISRRTDKRGALRNAWISWLE